MGRRSPDSPDVVTDYNGGGGKMDKYRHRSPASPSSVDRRRYAERSVTPVKRRSRRSRSYDSPDRRHRNNRKTTDNPPPSRCVGIFGMNIYTRESQIRDLFSKFGEIRRINMITCSQTGRSRGFGFVYFQQLEDAINAKEQTNGMELDERRIRVDYSITDRAHTPTPGTYMGSRYDSRYRQRGNYDHDRRRRYDRRRSPSRSRSRSYERSSRYRSSKRHRHHSARSHSRSD
ncbi:transformer-2 protein homolog alpha [Culicoides brevitarsis]|uniref:transformer-2 protein homolog alpha n=1 Tax=Culicoides brevitarsis TaxID=469753 RepID=UPI00307C3556